MSAFQDLRDEMENIRRVMEEEKSEARDREVRLNNKVAELGKQLAQANLAIDGLTTKVPSLESELCAVTTTTTPNSADFGQSKTGGRKRRAKARNAADSRPNDDTAVTTGSDVTSPVSLTNADLNKAAEVGEE